MVTMGLPRIWDQEWWSSFEEQGWVTSPGRLRAMGFRQFLLRGLAKVQAEWSLVCTAHNLLKLTRARA